ncbi:MAG: hypothetical protein QG670_1558 [Thermoproteota archaeon]|nr:hypothetical protein [Thermoproteota archaeon]
MSEENPIIKLGLFLNRESRAVYLLVFIICFAGALYPISLPNKPATQWVQNFYNEIEKLKPGDVVFMVWALAGGDRADFANINGLVYQIWSKQAGILNWVISAETQTWMDTVFYQPLLGVDGTAAEKTAPLYGTQWVDLGYLPSTREAVTYGAASNLRTLVASRDKFGTNLDSLPMMGPSAAHPNGVNKATDFALVISVGSGGPPAVWTVPIGAFYLAYGVPCIGTGEGETYTEAAYLVQCGLEKGFAGALWGSRMYEQLVVDKLGISTDTAIGSTKSVSTQVFYVGMFVVIAMIAHNVYSLGMKRKGD